MRYRTQTILFTDIVGSTEVFGARSGFDAEHIRGRHFSSVRGQIEHHHGREIKRLGDGSMAAFESVHDALVCAAEIQRSTSAESDLRLRIGVSTGDVTVIEGDMFGTAVVEASRLCARAVAGEILVADVCKQLARDVSGFVDRGSTTLKGLEEPRRVWELPWRNASRQLRVVLADDALLVREGIAHVLDAAGMQVVGQTGDAVELLRLVTEFRPDVAVIDVHMPPTFTRDGLDAAIEIRRTFPLTAVVLLSADLAPCYARQLMAASATGVGYLLKDRVADGRDFALAVHRVADGGTMFDVELDDRTVGSRSRTSDGGQGLVTA